MSRCRQCATSHHCSKCMTLALVAGVVVICIQIFREQSIIIPFYRNVLPLCDGECNALSLSNAQCHMFICIREAVCVLKQPPPSHLSACSFQFSVFNFVSNIFIFFLLPLSTALLSAYRLTHYGSTFRLFHYFIRFSSYRTTEVHGK